MTAERGCGGRSPAPPLCAETGRWRLDLPPLYPAGECRGRSPADLAVSFVSAPYPPTPLPRRGRGGFLGYFMQGASPLASPRLSRKRHLQSLPIRHPQGACLLCRLPTLPLVSFLAPYPPRPRSQSALPRWGRGIFRLFHARGFAPCIPGV